MTPRTPEQLDGLQSWLASASDKVLAKLVQSGSEDFELIQLINKELERRVKESISRRSTS